MEWNAGIENGATQAEELIEQVRLNEYAHACTCNVVYVFIVVQCIQFTEQ